jgi:hypothetical protein
MAGQWLVPSGSSALEIGIDSMESLNMEPHFPRNRTRT